MFAARQCAELWRWGGVATAPDLPGSRLPRHGALPACQACRHLSPITIAVNISILGKWAGSHRAAPPLGLETPPPAVAPLAVVCAATRCRASPLLQLALAAALACRKGVLQWTVTLQGVLLRSMPLAPPGLLCPPPQTHSGPHAFPPFPPLFAAGLSLYSAGWPTVGNCVQLGIPVMALVILFAFHLRRVRIFGCGVHAWVV